MYTVDDYWDGPRLGVADFEARPHAFRRIFDEAIDEWSENFLLKALSLDQFHAVMDDWAIWLRWTAAYHAGLITIATHPALPEDIEEHRRLRERVDAALDIPADSIVMRGRFEKDHSAGELYVIWAATDRGRALDAG